MTENEKKALRFYIGDVHGTDPFYGDPKAYTVINSLFFPELLSESARAAEGKFLNPAIPEDQDRLLSFFADLFSAFGKCRAVKNMKTCRVERFSDYEYCKKSGFTLSFTSTSKAGFLSSYRDRLGIALMEFDIPAGTHCIDVSEVLDFYAKPEEAELLLPPFTALTLSERAPKGSETAITDAAGESPKVFCRAEVSGTVPFTGNVTALPEGGNTAAVRVLKALNSKAAPSDEDIRLYSQWKSALVTVLHKMFCDAVLT